MTTTHVVEIRVTDVEAKERWWKKVELNVAAQGQRCFGVILADLWRQPLGAGPDFEGGLLGREIIGEHGPHFLISGSPFQTNLNTSFASSPQDAVLHWLVDNRQWLTWPFGSCELLEPPTDREEAEGDE